MDLAGEHEPLRSGSTIGRRYLVLRVLGQGGMGSVLEVEHIALGRKFALKLLRLGATSEELVARFQREARALASISSPRVAQVTDFGVEPRIGPFYVMELVEGENLEAVLLREGRLPPEHAVAIAISLCEALADVHAAGIVHRDVKPSNIGICPKGPVPLRLLDFGLAASVDDSFLKRITRSQQILGSAPYMAPELLEGDRYSPAIDLWAIGVVTYEMLTGELPFNADGTAALMHRILHAPMPPFPAELSVPADVAQVVERLLVKNPMGRYDSAEDTAAAFRAVASAPRSSRGPALPPTRLIANDVGMKAMGTSTAPATGMPGASTPPLGLLGTLAALPAFTGPAAVAPGGAGAAVAVPGRAPNGGAPHVAAVAPVAPVAPAPPPQPAVAPQYAAPPAPFMQPTVVVPEVEREVAALVPTMHAQAAAMPRPSAVAPHPSWPASDPGFTPVPDRGPTALRMIALLGIGIVMSIVSGLTIVAFLSFSRDDDHRPAAARPPPEPEPVRAMPVGEGAPSQAPAMVEPPPEPPVGVEPPPAPEAEADTTAPTKAPDRPRGRPRNPPIEDDPPWVSSPERDPGASMGAPTPWNGEVITHPDLQ